MANYYNAVLKIVVFMFQDPFKTFGRSVVKTTVMAIGEFDYTNMLIDGLGQANNRSGIRVPLIPFPAVSNTFFYIFLLTMPIVLMNLLVRLRIVCRGGEGRGVMTPLVPYPIIFHVFFYIFLLTMPIVLMNLLVRVRIVCRGGEGSYDPTGFLSYHLQRIFLRLLADHADCAYEPTDKNEDCMWGRGAEL